MREHEIHLFGASRNTWCRQRQILSPTFSKHQVKSTTRQTNHCIQSLIEKLNSVAENEEKSISTNSINDSQWMSFVRFICKREIGRPSLG